METTELGNVSPQKQYWSQILAELNFSILSTNKSVNGFSERIRERRSSARRVLPDEQRIPFLPDG